MPAGLTLHPAPSTHVHLPMNTIIEHLRTKTARLGIESAAAYFSGDSPGKPVTTTQLQKVLAGDDMPTPRMCLKVAEELKMELGATRAVHERTAQRISELEKILSQRDETIRQLESQGLATAETVAPSQPFAPAAPVIPATRQPWERPAAAERPLAVQPWMIPTSRTGAPVRAADPYEDLGS